MPSDASLAPRRPLRGILCALAGVALFSIQDVILKRLSGAYPLPEAMVIRSLTALPLLLALVWRDGGPATLVTRAWPAMALRGLIMFFAYGLYYLALAAMPMATTMALYFAAPLFITLLSILFLGEAVSPYRWFCVLLGFAGVLIVIRPGGDLFDWAGLLAVGSGLCYAISMVAARAMGGGQTAAALAFWGNGLSLVIALILSVIFGSGAHTDSAHESLSFLTRGWVAPPLPDLGLMMLCGIIAAIGLTLLTEAYRVAEATTVAPFEYSAMVSSVLYGWLFWNDWPDRTGWIGITLIVGAGLMVLYGASHRIKGPAPHEPTA